MRWGTLGLGDVQVATHLVGAPVVAGSVAVRAGLVVALIAALAAEAAADGLRSGTVPAVASAVVALVALVPLFCVPGASYVLWLVVAALLAAVVLALARYARAVPRWAPIVTAAVGVVVATLAR